MNCPFGRTVDGFETHFGTNHLGHFVLVNRIAAADPRRRAGHRAHLDGAPHVRRGSRRSGLRTDGLRPVPGLWAVQDRQRPLRRSSWTGASRRRGVRGIAVQPGGVRTPLLRHTTPEVMQEMMRQVAAHSQRRADGSHDDPVPVKTVRAGRRDHRLGRVRRPRRRGGRPVLRGLPRRRGDRRGHRRRPALRRRSRARTGPVGGERGDRRRAVPFTRGGRNDDGTARAAPHRDLRRRPVWLDDRPAGCREGLADRRGLQPGRAEGRTGPGPGGRAGPRSRRHRPGLRDR